MIIKNKFIYNAVISIISKNDPYNKDYNINSSWIYYNKEDAFRDMRDDVESTIEKDSECTRENFLDRYDFKYTIFIISRDHIEFTTDSEAERYLNFICKLIPKEKYYEVLLSVANFASEEYDINGHLICGYMELPFEDIFISENSIKEDKSFKYGDIVERKGYPGIQYIVMADTVDDVSESEPYMYYGSVYAMSIDRYNAGEEINEYTDRYPRSEMILIKGDNENGKN